MTFFFSPILDCVVWLEQIYISQTLQVFMIKAAKSTRFDSKLLTRPFYMTPASQKLNLWNHIYSLKRSKSLQWLSDAFQANLTFLQHHVLISLEALYVIVWALKVELSCSWKHYSSSEIWQRSKMHLHFQLLSERTSLPARLDTQHLLHINL